MIPSTVITATHAETAARYGLGPCEVREASWDSIYDCDAKKKCAADKVFICDAHSVWWHEAPAPAPDFARMTASEKIRWIRDWRQA
jgi:hypothetical protein